MTERPHLSPEILYYYEHNHEGQRLRTGVGRLELERSQELITRHVMPPPAVVLDIGGGSGVYASWLARRGYEVHLRDPVGRLVEEARSKSAEHPETPLASARMGDARALEFDEACADAILLFGPLYHLVDRPDRLRALREAHRVLRPGGVAMGMAISRYASTLDGLVRGLLEDPTFVHIVDRDLAEGQHRNPTTNLQYFTTSYFHRPDELRAEFEEAGFKHEAILPVEGPAWLLGDLQTRLSSNDQREILLKAVRSLETAPSLLGVSAHLMEIARKAR